MKTAVAAPGEDEDPVAAIRALRRMIEAAPDRDPGAVRDCLDFWSLFLDLAEVGCRYPRSVLDAAWEELQAAESAARPPLRGWPSDG